MRQFLIHFLILTLVGSGLVYAADGQGEGETSHSSADSELVMHADSGHIDEDDGHHAHHGCHLSVHLIGLTSETTVFKHTQSQHAYAPSFQAYASRFPALLTKPPRV